MPSEAEFLRAILADPDADGPRLVYADWREECGDPARAEFIRVQCALAAMPEDERDFHQLRDRERELLAAHQDVWLRPLIELLGASRPRRWFREVDRWHAEFRRGFVEVLSADLDSYLHHAATLGRMAPLRDVCCRGPAQPDAMDRLIVCPQLSSLTAFSVRLGPLSPVTFGRLIGCPFLANLRALTLASDVEAGCIAVLENSPLLACLTGLHLCDAPRLVHGDAISLLQAPAAKCLQELSLVNTSLMLEDFFDVLRTVPVTPRLRRLNLSGSHLAASGNFTLCWLPADLADLVLSRAGLGRAETECIAGSPALRQLRRLDLSGNRIDDVGALTLADSPNLLASTQLDLRGNPISPRVRDALRIRCGHHVLA
jgi:uncharacterized protein (TIGR02996 family)